MAAVHTVVHFEATRPARLAARALGGSATAIGDLAARLTEADLELFPPLDLAETEEHNALLFDAVAAGPAWERQLERAARVARADALALERMCRQRFVLWHGRRISQIRELLAMRPGAPLTIASDLPPEVLGALRYERRWGGERLRVHAGASRILRAWRFCTDLRALVALHAGAALRIVQLAALPARRGEDRRPYAAWIGAEQAAVAAVGPSAFSLPEFFADALKSGAVDEVVLQGASPTAGLPPGVVYRRSRFALRARPRLAAIARALLAQARLLLHDLFAAADWRARQLLTHVTAGAPGTALWFSADPPRAVLYPNSVIGAEPAAAAVGRAYGVPTMMAFYSANVAHTVTPAAAPSPGGLEPEMRYVAAERLAMWSEAMRAAFEQAGYAPERLPVTGVLHYGRQSVFRVSSRFAAGSADGPVRIGVFDVSLQHPARRFLIGYGQTFYCRRNRDAFFHDLTAAAGRCWGENFVIVRKLKRELRSDVHTADIDLEALVPATRIRSPGPDTSLWSVLSEVDLVVCMPFTSVAYMADHYGIPAAYYDPSRTITPSPLAGRCPLLRGAQELLDWLSDPRPHPGHDPAVVVAAETLKAACGEPWRQPRLSAPAAAPVGP